MNIKNMIELYKKESIDSFDSIPVDNIVKFIEMIFEAYDKEKTVFSCANGGGAAFVQNFVTDLNLHPFVSDDKSIQNIPRNRFKCVNLCADQSIITGIGNDLGFDFIFSEQLKYQGEAGDIIFGISGSGNSKNILQIFKVAKQKGMKTILVTRNSINKCNEFSDLVLCVSGVSSFPGQIGGNNLNFCLEDLCSKLAHIVVGLLKQKVHDENKSK